MNKQNTKRNLDHLEYDENLYDLMKSMIPFNMISSNNSVNQYLLNRDGLEKQECLNIYFNDQVGKRELVQDLVLSAILPREWSQEDYIPPDGINNQAYQSQAGGIEPIQIPEGQELCAIILDI